MPEVFQAHLPEHFAAATALFKEYANWLGIDLCFQNFDEELLELPVMYGPPKGSIFLCREGDEIFGCVAVRQKGEGIAELKRMFVQTKYQRSGAGNLLLNRALDFAKEAGYKLIRLDTLSHMTPAINLYKKAGFYEIEPYYFNPEKGAVFFEKTF